MSELIHEADMPAPRLELRWLDMPEPDAKGYTIECVYSLVIALGKYDIRAEQVGPRGGRKANLKELSVKIGSTRSTGESVARIFMRDGKIDTPFRDGAHAQWDAAQLGNIPVYAVANGQAMLVERRQVTE